ncbi:MAG: glycosyltransferase family 2 protein [Terricaulis sp.]
MPDVTICIPAWQAEAFIARTLGCARAQTHQGIRILVSIDQSDDATESICRALARDDPRIEVIAQSERLGWSENANFLMRQVETEYFFLYFHDDLIEPTYVSALHAALEARPDAMSAHCDLEKFGNEERIETGAACDGAADRRLITYLVQETKGPLLRGLTRRAAIDAGLSFPDIAGNGNWRVPPFALRLLAAGPALYVPRTLYRRWMRDGSLTRTWAPASAQALIDGQRQCAALCLAIIDGIDASEQEKDAVRFCLGVRMMIRTRAADAV